MSLNLYTLGAATGTLGLATMSPVPHGFENWPIAPILGFIVLACLALLGYSARTSAATSLKVADALTKMAERQSAQQTQVGEIIRELRANTQASTMLVAQLQARPCLHFANQQQLPAHVNQG